MSAEGLMWYFYVVLILYIVSSVIFLVYMAKNESNHINKNELLNKFLSFSLIILTLPMEFAIAVIIWSDKKGSGDVLSYDGVISLFSTKSEYWLIGIWGETIICAMMIVVLIVYDAVSNSFKLWFSIPLLLLVIPCQAFALIPHIIIRTTLLFCCKKTSNYKLTKKI
eukprot:UN03532